MADNTGGPAGSWNRPILGRQSSFVSSKRHETPLEHNNPDLPDWLQEKQRGNAQYQDIGRWDIFLRLPSYAGPCWTRSFVAEHQDPVDPAKFVEVPFDTQHHSMDCINLIFKAAYAMEEEALGLFVASFKIRAVQPSRFDCRLVKAPHPSEVQQEHFNGTRHFFDIVIEAILTEAEAHRCRCKQGLTNACESLKGIKQCWEHLTCACAAEALIWALDILRFYRNHPPSMQKGSSEAAAPVAAQGSARRHLSSRPWLDISNHALQNALLFDPLEYLKTMSEEKFGIAAAEYIKDSQTFYVDEIRKCLLSFMASAESKKVCQDLKAELLQQHFGNLPKIDPSLMQIEKCLKSLHPDIAKLNFPKEQLLELKKRLKARFTGEYILNKKFCDISGTRPRSHSLFYDDKEKRAIDLIMDSVRAKRSSDDRHYEHYTPSKAGSNSHHLAFTVDFPDAMRCNEGSTHHRLIKTSSRYLVLLNQNMVITLPLLESWSEHPFEDIRAACMAYQDQYKDDKRSSVLSQLLQGQTFVVQELIAIRDDIENRALVQELDSKDKFNTETIVKSIHELQEQMLDLSCFTRPKHELIRKLAAALSENESDKASASRTKPLAFAHQLLWCLEARDIIKIQGKFHAVEQRLDNLSSSIETIKQSFESRLHTQANHEQKKLQKAISWMTQISIMALPINIVSGFLGMNVYIPGIDRFSSDSDIFWWIVGACFFASIIILLLFATEKKHRWKFGILPSKHEEQLEHEPLKYLLKENTVPWFYHHHHLQDFTVEHNLMLLHWSRRKLKVEEWISKAKQAMLNKHYTQAVAALDKALRSIEKHRPSFNKSGQEQLQKNVEKEISEWHNEIKRLLNETTHNMRQRDKGKFLENLFFKKQKSAQDLDDLIVDSLQKQPTVLFVLYATSLKAYYSSKHTWLALSSWISNCRATQCLRVPRVLQESCMDRVLRAWLMFIMPAKASTIDSSNGSFCQRIRATALASQLESPDSIWDGLKKSRLLTESIFEMQVKHDAAAAAAAAASAPATTLACVYSSSPSPAAAPAPTASGNTDADMLLLLQRLQQFNRQDIQQLQPPQQQQAGPFTVSASLEHQPKN